MNEKIKLLAEQANIHFSRVGILDGDPNGMAKFVSYSKMEKFAELFVRECAEWLKTTDSDPDIGEADAKALLEHFGVED